MATAPGSSAWAAASRLRLGKQSFGEAVQDPSNKAMIEATAKRKSQKDPWVACCRTWKEMQPLLGMTGDHEDQPSIQNWQIVALTPPEQESPPQPSAPLADAPQRPSPLVSFDWEEARRRLRYWRGRFDS